MSKSSTYENSPVDKLTLSENKGRYNLFTTKDRAEQLDEYTEHLAAVIPSWLEGTTKNNGNCIAASIKPALSNKEKPIPAQTTSTPDTIKSSTNKPTPNTKRETCDEQTTNTRAGL